MHLTMILAPVNNNSNVKDTSESFLIESTTDEQVLSAANLDNNFPYSNYLSVFPLKVLDLNWANSTKFHKTGKILVSK